MSCGVGNRNFEKQKYTKLKPIKTAVSEEKTLQTHFQTKTLLFNEPERVELELEFDKEVDLVLNKNVPESIQLSPNLISGLTYPLETDRVYLRVNREKSFSSKEIANRNKKMKKSLLVFLIIIGFLIAFSLGTFGLFWIAWGRGVIGALLMITAIIGIILLFYEIKKIRNGTDPKSTPRRKRAIWASIISISILLILLSILL